MQAAVVAEGEFKGDAGPWGEGWLRLVAPEDSQSAAWSDAGSGRFEGVVHAVYCAQGDAIEAAAGGHGFDAAGPDFGGEG